MTNTFDTVVEQKWSEEAHLVFEQKVSKFRGRTREMRANAKTGNFQVFTDTGYHTNKVRNAPIIIDAQNVQDVTVSSNLYYAARMIDRNDEALVNFDYRNVITEECVNQINHAIDDSIITALLAYSSTNQGASLPTAYTSNYAGMSWVAEQLDNADVPMEDRHCVLSPQGYRNELLTDSVFINNFHVYQGAIATGQIAGQDCAGLDTFWSTRLKLVSGGESGALTCYAWHKNALGLLISEDLIVSVDWVPQYLGFQFSASIQVGAVITDNTGVVAFDVK